LAETSKAGVDPLEAKTHREAAGVSAAAEALGWVEAEAERDWFEAVPERVVVVPPPEDAVFPEDPAPVCVAAGVLLPDAVVLVPVGSGSAGRDGAEGSGTGSVGSGASAPVSGCVTGASGSVPVAAWLGAATAASPPPATRSAAQVRRRVVRWSRIVGARFRRRW
jgi:hypothetical protein